MEVFLLVVSVSALALFSYELHDELFDNDRKNSLIDSPFFLLLLVVAILVFIGYLLGSSPGVDFLHSVFKSYIETPFHIIANGISASFEALMEAV